MDMKEIILMTGFGQGTITTLRHNNYTGKILGTEGKNRKLSFTEEEAEIMIKEHRRRLEKRKYNSAMGQSQKIFNAIKTL